MFKLAVDKIENWIYVTGVIRSGTTFVGKILSLPLQVDYIHEPFNPLCGIPGMTKWYRYVEPSLSTAEMRQFHTLTKSIFSYDLQLRTWYPPSNPIHTRVIKQVFGSRGPFYLRLAKPNIFHRAAVIKDPTGNLATEYLYRHFAVKPVIVIKHPISFIASLKRVNWHPKLEEINDQPQLIEDYFADERDFIKGKYDNWVLEAAAYWRASYKVLLAQASQYPGWLVFTHEELSQSSVAVFKNLYDKLDLPWSQGIENKILQLTTGNSSAKARKGKVQDFKRNSADIFKTSIESISLTERRQIFEIVEDIALQVYDRSSFLLD
ncbi:sulfotransferase family protein [Myxosarcina sp. GI1]|uniref:sulfotransferase family protein n=1 Tax=Myxosarcina sp. GI1 TaxID=1541065 RepID=UPI0005664F44|nr:sulfotransferase family protein [Myxosarcina sp. GI1]